MTQTRTAKDVVAKHRNVNKTPAAPARKAAATKPAAKADAGGRRIQVRRSGVHGKGVFALKPIAKGETIIEYTGRIMSWAKAQKLPPHNPAEPNHTFFFQIEGGKVIDAVVGGNASRWINHSCAPNCQAEEDEDCRVFIKALRNIKPGEELAYNYGLVIEERYTPSLKKEFECRCGAPKCRRTMLAPKR